MKEKKFKKLVEKTLHVLEGCEVDKNGNKKMHIVGVEKLYKKLTLTDDVMGDSEQLPSFLYKSDGGLYFKHIEDTDITEQWNEYLKTR